MPDNKELILTRVFDAPREMVFKAWTDPDMVKQWWGPRGVTNPICEVDATPGGALNIVMEAGEELGLLKGQKWPMRGEFKEVIEPEKLVFTGNAIINDKEIMQHLCTVTFEEKESKTVMTVHIVVTKITPEAEGALRGMEPGWNQQLDKLGEFLSK